MLGADDASLAQHFGSDGNLTERGKLVKIHDVKFFAKDVGEAALGHAAMERHLAAFKSAHHARATARTLTFVSAGRGLAHAGTHAAADTLLARIRLLRCSNIREIHKLLVAVITLVLNDLDQMGNFGHHSTNGGIV